MKLLPPIITERDKITRLYRLAVYSYITPFLSLALYILDSVTFGITQMLFFVLFLVGLFPLGTLGLVYTIRGLKISFSTKDYQKKDIGYANLLAGLIMIVAGLVGLGLIYIMVN